MEIDLLLGDNPFLGVSHLSQEKAIESFGSGVEAKARVVVEAFEAGASGFTFSTDPINLEILMYLRDEYPSVLYGMDYYPLVPYAYRYVRQSTRLGTVGLAKNVLLKIINIKNIPSLIRALSGSSPGDLLYLFLVYELAPYIKLLPSEKIKGVLLHEVITDVLLAFESIDMVCEVSKQLRRKYGLSLGVETRNVTRLWNWLVEGERCIDIEYVMTPLNRLGYQMAWSKESAEEAIIELSKNHKIIAINILASGAIDLESAIDYLKGYVGIIHAIAIGTSKPERARQNFTLLRTRLVEDNL